MAKIDFRYNFGLYWSFLRKYKPLFIGLLIVIFLVQAALVVERFLFKIIIDRGTEFTTGVLTRNAFAEILIIIAIVFLGAVGFIAIGKWTQLHLLNKLECKLVLDLKKRFFNHIVHLHYGFHTSNRTGSLISRIIRGGSATERLTDVIVFNGAPLVFQAAIVFASIVYFDAVSALVTLIVIAVFIAYSFYISNLQRESNLRANDAEDLEKANISDMFTNIETIKFFGKEARIKSRYAKLAQITRMEFLKNWQYFRWLDLGHMIILGVGTALIVYFPMIKFLNREVTMGSLVFIYTTYGMLYGPLFGFVHGIRGFYRAMADLQALFKYSKIHNVIKTLPGAKKCKIRKGRIEFKNVNFSYKKRRVFDNFNLMIPENKIVALVGPSGCGKTTLIRLLYRLFDVERGGVLVDGRNVRSFKQETLRSELSVVPQECILFDDTIYNNISFSNPKAKRHEIMRAMKFAQLDKIVKHLPKKEKTVVGERGIKLSGGEKQRVSIARALLAGKKVLVLDEATSSLDSETESDIQNALQRLMKGKTSIIIAHRLSTIMKADIIVVMDKGKIVQKGNHRTLIKQKGMYKKLWGLQKGGYIK